MAARERREEELLCDDVVVLLAKHDIGEGEELFFNYSRACAQQSPLVSADAGPTGGSARECRCGAVGCRRVF
jgi:hypothetical protein